LDESIQSGLNNTTVNMLTHGQSAILKTHAMPIPQHNEGQSKYVQAKTLAEMEFDVEEYKNPKEDGGVMDEMKSKFKKIKKGLA